jgi:hypothetical protein
MDSVLVLVGGSVSSIFTAGSTKNKHDVAKRSVKDNSNYIDRVTAARMRLATLSEMERLANMKLPDFRSQIQMQGFDTARYDDRQLNKYISLEVLKLNKLAHQFLVGDFKNSQTPLLVSGNPVGSLGLAFKVLGPTVMSGFRPIGVSVWWNCSAGCKIDTVHFYDKSNIKVFKP